MEGYASKCPRICRVTPRGFVFLIGLMTSLVLAFQTFSLPYRYDLSPIFPNVKMSIPHETGFAGKVRTSTTRARKFSLLTKSLNFTYMPRTKAGAAKVSSTRGIVDNDVRTREIHEYTRKNGDSNDAIALDWGDDFNKTVSKNVGGSIVNLFTTQRIKDKDNHHFKENIGGLGNSSTSVSDHFSKPEPVLAFEQLQTLNNKLASLPLTSTVISNDPSVTMDSITVSSGEGTTQTIASAIQQVKERFLKNETLMSLQTISNTQNNGTEVALIPLLKKKKQVMPPVYLPEMNKLFIRNHASHHSMRPRWSSALDTEILAAKAQIEKAPVVKNDRKLHAPLFRNLSMFRRSYELMEQTLKVYIYAEGGKPIFHQPLLGGIYASEGWFMKLMETNVQFVVPDPRRAHLFYMPFSSRYLQSALYVQNSHSKTNLEDHLKNYVALIASKHPFWNRTGGADHFLVACHDWETKHYSTRSKVDYASSTHLCRRCLHC